MVDGQLMCGNWKKENGSVNIEGTTIK